MKFTSVFVLLSVFIASIALPVNANESVWDRETEPHFKNLNAIVYSSPSCSCCEGWIKHIQKRGIGILALIANLICLFLLTRHRNDNINMSSVWLCSRNDIIANTSVLLAAGLVFLTGSFLPDLVVGLLLTVVFAKSAGKVLFQSWRELQQA